MGLIFGTLGTIEDPLDALSGGSYSGLVNGGGLLVILNNLIKLAIVGAGIYAFWNIVLAGYGFLSSPEAKDIGKAWSRIYQSMYGLLIVAGAFVLAAIFGWIIFKDPMALLAPKFYGP
ncbi:hypothetical protein HZB69_00730 [Candidatus Amesbacteria bacterium]|nr:hypothetical protein [Candidatus Amesbacteria bacterium]